MGPRHRTKAWGTQCFTRQTDPPIPAGTRRTAQIRQRTPTKEDDSTVEKPLYSILFLHQEEGRKITTGTGLSTRQQVDHPKPLPTATNSPASRQTPWMLTLHQIRHPLGLQQHTNQGR